MIGVLIVMMVGNDAEAAQLCGLPEGLLTGGNCTNIVETTAP